LATGKIICQWDDDDLYHPERLMTQYNALRVNSNYVASAYCDFLKYYRNTGEIYWCDWSGERIFSGRLLSGSVMFYKEMFGMFPCFYPQSGSQCHVEEDLNVMNKLLSKGEVAPIWSGWHYVYMYHGSNTYDLAHHNLTLDVTSGKKVLTASQLLERRDLIENAFDSIGFDRSVSVRSKEGLAFTYDPKRRIIDS
jgi:glycosyltransferase involved in cell wall biosynthesis